MSRGNLSPDLLETGPCPECCKGSPEVTAGSDLRMCIVLSSACLATSSHLSTHPNWDVMEPKLPAAAGSPRGQPALGNRVCEQHLRGQGLRGGVASARSTAGLQESLWSAVESGMRGCCAQERGAE